MTAVELTAPSVAARSPMTPAVLRAVHSAPDLVVSAFAGFGLPAMLLLLNGRFSPGWVLPLGLIGAAVAVAVCGISREPVDRRAVMYTLVAIALVLVWVIVNSFYTGQNLYAHRDPATYNLAGRWLMDHASLHIPVHADVFGSPSGAQANSAGFSNSAPTELYAQGNHLLPAMLAVSGWLFGVGAIFEANVVFGGLALLAFFGLARRVMDDRFALLAMVVYGVSMPMLFVSRDTYSEPLAMLFIVGGLALLHRAVESGRLRDFGLAGFVVAMSAPARIDGSVTLVAVLVAAGALPIFVARPGRRDAVIRSLVLVGGMAIPTLVGWLDVTQLSYGYYHDNRSRLLPIFYVGYALLVILPAVVLISWRPRVRRWLRSPELARRAGYVAGGLIAAGFVVLASRPLWMVDHATHNNDIADLQRRAGEAVDITRSYNEQNVNRLAQYYGWPVVVLGVIGYILLVRRCLRTRAIAPLAMITVGLAMSLLYLWTSEVTPDEPWASRRYVTIIIPVLVIAAMYTLCVLFRQRTAVLRIGAVLLAAVAIAVPTIVTAPMASAREEVPQRTQVERICQAVGTRGAVLDVDGGALTSYGQTVRSYCNVPSLGLQDAQPAQLAQVRDAVASHGRTLYLLSNDVNEIQFAPGTKPLVPYSAVRTTRWPSVLHGPPSEVDHETVTVYIATVRPDGLAVPVTPPGR